MMYRKKILCLSVLAASAISLSGFAATLPGVNSKLKVPSPQLGGGYSTDNSQSVMNICLNKGPVTTSGANTGTIDLATEYDLSDVENQLNFSANGHVGIGLFSASASFDFMHYLESDNLSESLIYRTTDQFMDTNYNTPSDPSTPILNAVGTQHWNNGPDDFRTYCGDSYVAQMHNGGSLYVALQFSFTSNTDKQKFDASFGGSYANFANFNAQFQQEIDKLNVHGQIHVVGLQIGGMPQYIGAIFGTTDPTKPSPITQCSLSDVTACQQLMTAVVAYLEPGDGHSPQAHYPDQFGDNPSQAPINTAETGIETKDYNAIVPVHSNSNLTPAIVAMRDQLGTTFETQNAYAQRASYIMNIINIPYAYDAYRSKLQGLANNLDQNTQNLQIAGATCFNNLSSCLKGGQSVLNGLLPVDPTILNLPDTFLVTTTDGNGIQHQQTFVAVDESQPIDEIFQGAETSPNSETFDLSVAFDTDTGNVSIQQLDHTTQQLVGNFDGNFQGNNQYTGTIQYADGSAGTWTGTFVPASHSSLTLTRKPFGQAKP